MPEIKISRAQLRMERVTAYRDDTPNARLRTRDIAGQKLVDVVDPTTGFCTGVRSAIESAANNIPDDPKPGINVSQKDLDQLPHYDAAKGVWFVGKDRLVQRTIDTPDGPLKVARVVKPAVAEKLDRRAAAASKVKRAPKDAAKDAAPAAQRVSNRVSTKEITEFIRTKYGYTGPLTEEMRRAARVVILNMRKK